MARPVGSSSSRCRASRGRTSPSTTSPRSRASSRERHWPTWLLGACLPGPVPATPTSPSPRGRGPRPSARSTDRCSPSTSRAPARPRGRSSPDGPGSLPTASSSPSRGRPSCAPTLGSRTTPCWGYSPTRSTRAAPRAAPSATPTAPTRSAPRTSGRWVWPWPTRRASSPTGHSARTCWWTIPPARSGAASTSIRCLRGSARRGPTPLHAQVVLVEASDLARALRYRPMVNASRYRTLWRDALVEADDLLAGLLASVDLERDLVLVLAPYNLRGDRDLTAVGLRGPGIDAGYLRSASTQRAGFLTLVDVAPTILRHLDIERPVDMEGRPAEAVASSATLGERVDHLVALNAASRFRERLLVPTTLVAVVGLALLAAAAVIVHVSGRAKRWRGLLRFGALVDLAVLPLSYLARGFALEDLGAGFYWAFVLVGVLVAAGLATMAARVASRPAPGAPPRACLHVPRAGRRRDDRIAPQPERRLRLLAHGQLASVRHQQLLVRAAGDGGLPARRVRGWHAAVPASAAGGTSVCSWRRSSCSACRCGVPTSVACSPSRRPSGCSPCSSGGGSGSAPWWPRGWRPAWPSPPSVCSTCPGRPRSGPTSAGCSSGSATRGRGPCSRSCSASCSPTSRCRRRRSGSPPSRSASPSGCSSSEAPRPPIQRLRAATPTLSAGLAATTVAAVLGSLVNDSGAIVGGVAAMVLTASLVWLTAGAVADVSDRGRTGGRHRPGPIARRPLPGPR